MFGKQSEKDANKGSHIPQDEVTHISALLNVISEKRKEAVKELAEQTLMNNKNATQVNI